MNYAEIRTKRKKDGHTARYSSVFLTNQFGTKRPDISDAVRFSFVAKFLI